MILITNYVGRHADVESTLYLKWIISEFIHKVHFFLTLRIKRKIRMMNDKLPDCR